MNISKMTKEDYKKQGLIIEALTQDQLKKEKEQIKKNKVLIGLSIVFFLLSVVIAFAHPSDGLYTAPDFMTKPHAVTATSVNQGGKLYSLLGYTQREDTPLNEGIEWLDNIINQHGLVYEKCVQTADNVFICKNMKTRTSGQNIGFLGVKSGISKEN